jgi:hypothetical protein
LLLLLLGAILFYFSNAFRFLAITKHVEPGIMIIEGWLSDDALIKARDEFIQKNYQLILTTGFPYEESFIMAYSSKLMFMTEGAVPERSDSLYNLCVNIKGTKADGEFAHFRIYADNIEIDNGWSSRKLTKHQYKIKLNAPPDQIVIEFDNDLVKKGRDRNLIVGSISVNDKVFSVNNQHVHLYNKNNEVFYFKKELSSSSAVDAALFLRSNGIMESLVIPIVTSRKFRSKTYSTALDVKDWLSKNLVYQHEPITIYSQGIHARRTWLSFQKAFGKSANIGVISSSHRKVSYNNWWKTRKGWKEMVYETCGLIYVFTFL